MQKLTGDYVMSQHAWDEIMTKLNEMAEENGLIKQAVCKTYNTTTAVLGNTKIKPILKTNTKTTIDDQQSVTMISEDTD